MSAVIYIICGNCGCNELTYVRGTVCKDGGDTSYLNCNDCATNHYLKDINE